MTASSRGRIGIAALIAVLAFGAAFAVHKATASSTHAPRSPTPLVIPTTPVHASGVTLPVATLPALRRPPHPTVSSPASSTPATSPTPSSSPTPAAPSAPSSGSGPVLVG
jgi:hypothetical protein